MRGSKFVNILPGSSGWGIWLLETPDQAVVAGIAIDLTKERKTHTVSFHLAIEPQNRMVFLYPKVLPDPFIGSNGQDLLFPSLDLYLVVLSEYFEQRSVLE